LCWLQWLGSGQEPATFLCCLRGLVVAMIHLSTSEADAINFKFQGQSQPHACRLGLEKQTNLLGNKQRTKHQPTHNSSLALTRGKWVVGNNVQD
jgi:hypothetical protein